MFYKVTGTFQTYIEAPDPEVAVTEVIEATGGMVHAKGHPSSKVYGVTTDITDFTATEIVYDPDEVARMDEWLSSFKD